MLHAATEPIQLPTQHRVEALLAYVAHHRVERRPSRSRAYVMPWITSTATPVRLVKRCASGMAGMRAGAQVRGIEASAVTVSDGFDVVDVTGAAATAVAAPRVGGKMFGPQLPPCHVIAASGSGAALAFVFASVNRTAPERNKFPAGRMGAKPERCGRHDRHCIREPLSGGRVP
jgi:hypothetical protein